MYSFENPRTYKTLEEMKQNHMSETLVIEVLRNNFEPAGDPDKNTYQLIVFPSEQKKRPLDQPHVIYTKPSIFYEKEENIDSFGKEWVRHDRFGGLSRFMHSSGLRVSDNWAVQPAIVIDNGSFYACLFRVDCYPDLFGNTAWEKYVASNAKLESFHRYFYFPVALEKREAWWKHGAQTWEDTDAFNKPITGKFEFGLPIVYKPAVPVTVNDLFEILKNTRQTDPWEAAIVPAPYFELSALPRDKPVRPATVEQKSEDMLKFTFDNDPVRAKVEIRANLWTLVVLLYEADIGDFIVEHLFPDKPFYMNVKRVHPLSFYALVQAAINSAKFTQVGPMWIRNDIMDDVAYFPDEKIVIRNRTIQTRPWTENDHANVPAQVRAKNWDSGEYLPDGAATTNDRTIEMHPWNFEGGDNDQVSVYKRMRSQGKQ